MKIEYEVKILDINVKDILGRLEKLGARKIIERNMKRFVYDLKDNSWIRLRFDGQKTTLTIKEIKDDSITGTKEIEVVVSDFDNANIILERIGFKAKAYQENKRISYKLDDVEIEIDFWPMIPPYIEIEGNSIKDVENIVEKLGFQMSQTTSINTIKVYDKYGIDLNSIKNLKF